MRKGVYLFFEDICEVVYNEINSFVQIGSCDEEKKVSVRFEKKSRFLISRQKNSKNRQI